MTPGRYSAVPATRDKVFLLRRPLLGMAGGSGEDEEPFDVTLTIPEDNVSIGNSPAAATTPPRHTR